MLRILACLSLLAFSGPCLAAPSDDEITAMLDTGDIAKLETTFADLHERQLDTGDAEVLRALHLRHFAVSHPARNATVAEWRRQMPESPYAAAAVAWQRLHEADNLEKSSQDFEPNRRTALVAATEAAEAAVALADDYVPSLEAWLESEPYGLAGPNRRRDVLSDDEFGEFLFVVENLLANAPDRSSFLTILNAVDDLPKATSDYIVGVCAEYADIVVGYDAEQCLIDAALHTSNGYGFRDAAIERLAEIEAPLLEDTRAEAALKLGFEMPDAAEKVVAWHRELLRPGVDLKQFSGDAARLVRKFDLPGYGTESKVAMATYVEARLKEDPLNLDLLNQIIAAAVFENHPEPPSPESLAKARALWPDLLAFGSQSAFTWSLGARLVAADRHISDVVPQMAYRESEIYYWGNTLTPVYHYFIALNTAYRDAEERALTGPKAELGAPEPEEVIAAVGCPLLRAARVLEALCRADGASASMRQCDFSSEGPGAAVPLVIAEGRDGLCDDIAFARLSELTYTPIPAAEIPAFEAE